AEQPVVPIRAANAKPANTFRRVVLTFTMVLLVKIRCARGDVLPALGASVPKVQDAFFMRLSYLTKWRPLYDKISPSVGAKKQEAASTHYRRREEIAVEYQS